MLFLKTHHNTPFSSNKNRTRSQICALFPIRSESFFHFLNKKVRCFLIVFSFFGQFVLHSFIKLALFLYFLCFNLILKASQTIKIFNHRFIASLRLKRIFLHFAHILRILITLIFRNSKDK